VLVAGLACVSVWAMQPIGFVLDGRPLVGRAGMTVAELAGSGPMSALRGDLLALDGTIATRGGGVAPDLAFDGRMAPKTARLYPGAAVTAKRGRSVREAPVTRFVSLPIPTEKSGRGPDREIRQLGAAGLARVTTGAVSHVVVDRQMVRPAIPMKVVLKQYPAGTPLVALTFDDGPWPGQTERVLEVLRSEGVKATFFMVGVRVRLATDLARSVVAAGHLVGNHTQTHVMLRGATPAQTRSQMDMGAQTLRERLSVEPRWFRAPGGMVTPAVRAEAAALGERIMGWTVDPADWRKPGSEAIVRRVLGAVRPGAVVLMHDGGGDRSGTIDALPRIISGLRARGYRFVTLDDL
jgi:peptidoglycan/xylan/chitin deacetylase (PgdA/CDA1 family)